MFVPEPQGFPDYFGVCGVTKTPTQMHVIILTVITVILSYLATIF